MKVFLSWSGERSRLVATLLDEWLRCVLQAIRPWISTKDIDRGSLWFSEIQDQLQDVTTGIICLTQENKEKPWILFENFLIPSEVMKMDYVSRLYYIRYLVLCFIRPKLSTHEDFISILHAMK